MTPILAHGTGIDDLLVFVVVAGLSVFALRLAERKARRRAQAEARPDGERSPANDA